MQGSLSIINSVCIFGIVLSQLLGFPVIIASTYERSVPVFIVIHLIPAAMLWNSYCYPPFFLIRKPEHREFKYFIYGHSANYWRRGRGKHGKLTLHLLSHHDLSPSSALALCTGYLPPAVTKAHMRAWEGEAFEVLSHLAALERQLGLWDQLA